MVYRIGHRRVSGAFAHPGNLPLRIDHYWRLAAGYDALCCRGVHVLPGHSGHVRRKRPALGKYVFLDGGTFGVNEISIMVVGCVVAFLVSLVAIKWLMGFVRRHTFTAFGIYRIVLGALVLAYFFVIGPMFGLV